MEDKLVILTIRTFEEAQTLRTILKTEGIEVYIHNVNQIQPIVPAGVRVRAKGSDLPHVLHITEDNKWFEEPKEEKTKVNAVKKVLVSTDFSDYSARTRELEINYAHVVGVEVTVMHAYLNPYFPSAIPMGDTLTYRVNEEESVQYTLQCVHIDMENICTHINRKMPSGGLPKVKYDYVLHKGLPEEEIIAYSKEYHPTLIVMGTRGKSRKNMDLVDSATGEAIGVNRVSVLAISENIPFTDLRGAKSIAFAISFNQGDLVASNKFMEIIKGFDLSIRLFNISASGDEWDEICLTGVREYFKKQCPHAHISRAVPAGGDLLLAIEEFIRDKQISVIALNTYRRDILARMFNPSIARKILSHTGIPLLIIDSKKQLPIRVTSKKVDM